MTLLILSSGPLAATVISKIGRMDLDLDLVVFSTGGLILIFLIMPSIFEENSANYFFFKAGSVLNSFLLLVKFCFSTRQSDFICFTSADKVLNLAVASLARACA